MNGIPTYFLSKTALAIGLFLVLLGCKKQPTACFAIDSKEVSLRDTLTPTNCSENAERYKWEFGDGTISEETSPSFSYAAQGEYMLRLTAFNGKKKSDFIERLITVGTYSIPELSKGTYKGIFIESHATNSSRDTSFTAVVKIAVKDTNIITVSTPHYGTIEWVVSGTQQLYELENRLFAQGIFSHTNTGNGKFIASADEFRMNCFGTYLNSQWTLTFRGDREN